MNQKTILYSSITIISLILAYFLFLPSNQRNRNNSDSRFSGNQSPRISSNGSSKEALISESNDSSLFDSENGFLDFSGSLDSDTNESSKKNSNNNTNSTSPEERARRRQLAIEKFTELAKLFPNNRYIPKKLSPEEEALQTKRDAAMNSLYDRVIAGDELNANEKAYFFQNKKLESAEKLELLDYVQVTLEGRSALSDTTKKVLDSRKNSIQGRLSTYENEWKEATKLGGSETNFLPPDLSEY